MVHALASLALVPTAMVPAPHAPPASTAPTAPCAWRALWVLLRPLPAACLALRARLANSTLTLAVQDATNAQLARFSPGLVKVLARSAAKERILAEQDRMPAVHASRVWQTVTLPGTAVLTVFIVSAYHTGRAIFATAPCPSRIFLVLRPSQSAKGACSVCMLDKVWGLGGDGGASRQALQ